MRDIDIILPVHNEKGVIESVIVELSHMMDKTKLDYKIIICEDGSTDGTKDILNKLKTKYKLILNQKEGRRGYGGAVIDGILNSDSKYILCLDSDGQCDPNDFSKFHKAFDKTDVLIGWRQNRADKLHRKIYSRFFKIVFDILFNPKIHDPSAPFVIFKKEDVKSHLHQLKFLKEGFWWGFVGMCRKNKLTISEIPINHRKREGSETQVYKLKEMPRIASTNLYGLIKLRFSK